MNKKIYFIVCNQKEIECYYFGGWASKYLCKLYYYYLLKRYPHNYYNLISYEIVKILEFYYKFEVKK